MPKTDTRFDPALYATVADRIQLFYERFPGGRIVTELVSRRDGETVFRVLAYRDDGDAHPAATGWAAERLLAMTPPGHEALIHVTLTDDHPWAQAFVVIEARPVA